MAAPNPPFIDRARARPQLSSATGEDIHPIGLIMPAVLMLSAVVLPNEVRIDIDGQTLYASRLMGLALLPVILQRLAKHPIRANLCDLVILLATAWMTVAFTAFYGLEQGLVRGGVLTFDAIVPYMVARTSFRDLSDLRRFLVIVSPIVLLVGLSMLVEVLAGRALVRPLAAQVFGAPINYEGGEAVGRFEFNNVRRFGILRAAGPFSHAILAGAFLVSFLPIYLSSGLRRWPIVIGSAAAVFAVLSVSSAAILGLVVSLGLLALDRIQRLFDFLSWKLLVPILVALPILIQLVTENGLFVLLGRVTFDPQTAYFRRLIWEFGTQSVMNYPLFGIGFTGYERLSWMPQTVDAHWLMLAIRFGIFPPLAILGVTIAAIIALASAAGRAGPADRRTLAGLVVALVTFIFFGFTVAFFGGVNTWFYLFLGMTVALGFSPRPAPVERGRLAIPAPQPLRQRQARMPFASQRMASASKVSGVSPE
jgi:hypothetical protein